MFRELIDFVAPSPNSLHLVKYLCIQLRARKTRRKNCELPNCACECERCNGDVGVERQMSDWSGHVCRVGSRSPHVICVGSLTRVRKIVRG